MTRLLKYLLPFIAAVVFWNCSDAHVSSISEASLPDMAFQEAALQTNISASDSELCLPRQVSFAGSQRVQSTSRRTSSVQRNNLEFIRSGKVINAGLRYFLQRKSIIVHSTQIDPANRLITLGQLII